MKIRVFYITLIIAVMTSCNTSKLSCYGFCCYNPDVFTNGTPFGGWSCCKKHGHMFSLEVSGFENADIVSYYLLPNFKIHSRYKYGQVAYDVSTEDFRMLL
jgi:hypothetical protein